MFNYLFDYEELCRIPDNHFPEDTAPTLNSVIKYLYKHPVSTNFREYANTDINQAWIKLIYRSMELGYTEIIRGFDLGSTVFNVTWRGLLLINMR